MIKLSSDDGTVRFCSPEKKEKACAIWRSANGNVKKPFGKVKRQKQKKLDGLFDAPACGIHTKKAIDKMVKQGVLG
jgi:hypothetical protein